MKKNNNAPVRGFWDWLTGGGGGTGGAPHSRTWGG
jgi:hypothetical protein